MSNSTTVTINDIEVFKRKALHWANHFKVVCLFDNNNHNTSYQSKDWLLGVDAIDELSCGENAFEQLKQFHANAGSVIFGFLGYDLKNQIEKLESNHVDALGFPDMYFFKPRYIIEISGDKVTVNRNYPETYELIERINTTSDKIEPQHEFTYLHPRTSHDEYLQNVQSIRRQIEQGDFYELNYCNEFYAHGSTINPPDIFLQLNKKAKAPFSCYFRLHDKYLLCASPERFLKKEGNKLISQPIKGTVRKGVSTEETSLLKIQLQNDLKERAENVMIVDLVRNDLAKSSKPGTVQVEELFGIHEFNNVIHMISTVVSEIREDVHFADAIKNAFPMGSMTGAPKVIVMENIEKYENMKRGLYSGAVGYITPEGDFDFNVVIRSILYNFIEKYLSIKVGGAITYDSVAEKEYEEMLLKAASMIAVLKGQIMVRQHA